MVSHATAYPQATPLSVCLLQEDEITNAFAVCAKKSKIRPLKCPKPWSVPSCSTPSPASFSSSPSSSSCPTKPCLLPSLPVNQSLSSSRTQSDRLEEQSVCCFRSLSWPFSAALDAQLPLRAARGRLPVMVPSQDPSYGNRSTSNWMSRSTL